MFNIMNTCSVRVKPTVREGIAGEAVRPSEGPARVAARLRARCTPATERPAMPEEPAYTPQERTDEQDHDEVDRPDKTEQGRTDQAEDDAAPRD